MVFDVRTKFGEYGVLQLGSLSKVHFRFDLVNGKPKLLPDMFVEGAGFKECLEGTQMYESSLELVRINSTHEL